MRNLKSALSLCLFLTLISTGISWGIGNERHSQYHWMMKKAMDVHKEYQFPQKNLNTYLIHKYEYMNPYAPKPVEVGRSIASTDMDDPDQKMPEVHKRYYKNKPAHYPRKKITKEDFEGKPTTKFKKVKEEKNKSRNPASIPFSEKLDQKIMDNRYK